MDDLADRAERVAVLSEGSLLMVDSAEHVFAQSELLVSVGLDVPQTSRLCMALRGRGVSIPSGIYDKAMMEKALLRLFGKGAEA